MKLRFYVPIILSGLSSSSWAIDSLEEFIEKPLSNYYGATSKSFFIEESNYKPSSIDSLNEYAHDQVYSQIPRIQSYPSHPQLTFLSIELPPSFIRKSPLEFMNPVYETVALKNIRYFFVAQSFKQGDPYLYPHPWAYPAALESQDFISKKILAGIFPISSPLQLESQPENSLGEAEISLKKGARLVTGHQSKLKINGFDKEKGTFFCSVVIMKHPAFNQYTIEGFQKSKAAVTFHYIPAEIHKQQLVIMVKEAKKVKDLYMLEPFSFITKLDKNYTQWPAAIKKYKSSISDLPADFNPHLYTEVNKNLQTEARDKDMDFITYAKWHYNNYGSIYKAPYFPENINLELYGSFQPGIREEAVQDKQDFIKYARWHYAVHGHNRIINLPNDFNPERYISLHSGLLQEALKENMDPLLYAKWHYTFCGYKNGLSYK